MARALAGGPARVLVLERGGRVPQEPENWSPEAVWKHLRYRTTERWLDAAGHEFLPYTHYGVGGNTKFWGSVLYRLRREDFQAVEHLDGVSPAWPIDYDTLAPFYDRAERLYQVHGRHDLDPTEPSRGPFPYPPIPHAPQMQAIVEALQDEGLHPSHLPLGLIRPGEPGGCVLCNTCNSFPCQIHAKSDAEVCGVAPALEHSNVELWTNAHARRLISDPTGRRVECVEVERDGTTHRIGASLFVVSCGAVNSAALLLRSASTRPSSWAWRTRQDWWASAIWPISRRCWKASIHSGRTTRSFRRRWPSTTSIFRGRARSTRSATSSRRDERTASWRRSWNRGSHCGPTRPGSRAASTGSRCPKTCRSNTTA